jgi:hypothetical protein
MSAWADYARESKQLSLHQRLPLPVAVLVRQIRWIRLFQRQEKSDFGPRTMMEQEP